MDRILPQDLPQQKEQQKQTGPAHDDPVDDQPQPIGDYGLGPLTGGILEGICRLVVNGIVYGYLIWQMVQGSVTLPAFLL